MPSPSTNPPQQHRWQHVRDHPHGITVLQPSGGSSSNSPLQIWQRNHLVEYKSPKAGCVRLVASYKRRRCLFMLCILEFIPVLNHPCINYKGTGRINGQAIRRNTKQEARWEALKHRLKEKLKALHRAPTSKKKQQFLIIFFSCCNTQLFRKQVCTSSLSHLLYSSQRNLLSGFWQLKTFFFVVFISEFCINFPPQPELLDLSRCWATPKHCFGAELLPAVCI